MLLPCFLEAARRTGAEEFHVVEIGPSAGLNLVWDRYRYRYVNGTWGSEAALLELQGEERSPVPGGLLALAPRVRTRTGIDVAPIDVTTESGSFLLRSFVWADMTDRLERLDRAVEAVRADPPQLRRGDVVEELPGILAGLDDGAVTLVVATAALGYVPKAGRRSVFDTLRAAGERSPVAYVGTTQPASGAHDFYGLELQLWPGGEREILAHADFHGRWLDWLA
jgi:hypothetical protein